MFLLGSVLVGLVLGLLGAGGSLLALPLLTYVADVPLRDATSYSLVVVGLLAMVGAVRARYSGNVSLRVGLWFVVPSIISVYIARTFLVPIVSELVIFIIFVMLLFGAGVKMLYGVMDVETVRLEYWKIIGMGLFVGLAAGLVGAGGGFLIVPALILLAGLDCKRAIGTSLFVIALQSMVGSFADMRRGFVFDWGLLGTLIFMGFIGLIVGMHCKDQVNSVRLRRAFARFLIVMAFLVVGGEMFL